MMLAYQPVRSLATINMTIHQGTAAAKRIFTVIDKPIEIKNDENLVLSNKCMEFKNVDYKYESNEKAIKDKFQNCMRKNYCASWSKWSW